MSRPNRTTERGERGAAPWRKRGGSYRTSPESPTFFHRFVATRSVDDCRDWIPFSFSFSTVMQHDPQKYWEILYGLPCSAAQLAPDEIGPFLAFMQDTAAVEISSWDATKIFHQMTGTEQVSAEMHLTSRYIFFFYRSCRQRCWLIWSLP